jgi:hypothetical protein
VGRGSFLLTLALLIVVPPALVIDLVALAGDASRVFLEVVVPAAIGASVGAAMVAWAGLRRKPAPREGGGGLVRIGITLIVAVAVAGVFRAQLPTWLGALADGWALGLVLAFYVLIVRLWKHDPDFRQRVKTMGRFAS